MKLGFLTVLYAERPLEAVLDRAVELGVDAVELGTGNYPGDAHCRPEELLADRGRARELRRAVEDRGLAISALSCHGNPLHPDREIAEAHHAVWRRTLELAEVLEVDVVNTFSGCPGDGPDARAPNWVTCAWPPDFAEVLGWQWDERLIPYWAREGEEAGRRGVRGIGLEMHPGFLVYNPETLLRLRAAAGEQIGANFDPSHLVWQGIEPVEAVRELGAAGAIVHAHAKDVYVDAVNVRRNGVLDTKPYDRVLDRAWTFRTVGYGHGEEFWRALVSTLRLVGYDGVLSIEHEDPLVSVDEGLEKAVALLRDVVLREPPGEIWWS
ncbi:MAG TPA: sugar phosphate isomerase/epimerase [Solirubrobacterales bacterium]|nr:sugar phosphate isomerase/epimerase [Solirubrobacterales bacterium]